MLFKSLIINYFFINQAQQAEQHFHMQEVSQFREHVILVLQKPREANENNYIYYYFFRHFLNHKLKKEKIFR